MKKFLASAVLIALIVGGGASEIYAGYVQGYTRSNGTYVQGYYRSDSNNTVQDNYSYKGNANPYTGEKGSNYYRSSESSGYYNSGNSQNSSNHFRSY